MVKVSPVSGDLLLKVGLVAGGVGLLAWLAYRNRNLVNPFSRDNAAYSSVNALGGALVTDPAGPGKNADGSWSLGGWLYDVTHPGTAAEVKAISGPVGIGPPGIGPEPMIDYTQYGYF